MSDRAEEQPLVKLRLELTQTQAENAELRRENVELRAALKPFAELAEKSIWSCFTTICGFTMEDCRRASDVLAKHPEGGP